MKYLKEHPSENNFFNQVYTENNIISIIFHHKFMKDIVNDIFVANGKSQFDS